MAERRHPSAGAGGGVGWDGVDWDGVDGDGVDWDGYYATVRVREPRDTLVRALEAFDQDDARAGAAVGAVRHAVDLGCGDGTDTLALLAAGWSVTAIDGSPSFPEHLGPRVPPSLRDRVTVEVADFREAVLPPCDLLHAGFSLFFCPPAAFDALWQRIRGAVRPGGRIAAHLIGPHDTWAVAGDPRMTWHSREQVDTLLAGLVVERLEETDEVGWSYAGDKRWHLWRVLARLPARAGPGGGSTGARSRNG
jgi:SAM-dependent methyltransferase